MTDFKTPLQRVPYSGSTDSRIVDASGEDIARISGGHDKTACIAYPDEVAKRVVRSVNGREHLLQELDRVREELDRRRATTTQLKTVNLDVISRRSDILFTHIHFEDHDLAQALTTKKEGAGSVTYRSNWLEFGECQLHSDSGQGSRSCYLRAPIRDGITDFEHDTALIIHLGLIGLQYEFTHSHVSHFKAHITTNPKDIQIYSPDFEPEKVEGAWMCEECDDHHWMLPDGYYVPPMYELAHVVAGKRINITMGPRWSALEPEEEASGE